MMGAVVAVSRVIVGTVTVHDLACRLKATCCNCVNVCCGELTELCSGGLVSLAIDEMMNEPA